MAKARIAYSAAPVINHCMLLSQNVNAGDNFGYVGSWLVQIFTNPLFLTIINNIFDSYLIPSTATALSKMRLGISMTKLDPIGMCLFSQVRIRTTVMLQLHLTLFAPVLCTVLLDEVSRHDMPRLAACCQMSRVCIEAFVAGVYEAVPGV